MGSVSKGRFGEPQIYMSCDDNCTHLHAWSMEHDGEPILYSVSFLSDYLGGEYRGLRGRIKAAVRQLFCKPVFHAEVVLNAERYEELLNKLKELRDFNGTR